jgi:beta-fructofuranosidase
VGRLDHGTNFYAASVLRDSPFGTVIWGWATEARSLEWSVSVDWAGMLTLPRALSMRTDGTVASFPLPTMEKLRTSQAEVVRHGSGVVRASGLPAQSEIRLDLDNGPSRPTVLARIRFGPSEHLDIGIDWSSGVVSIDRSHASADPRATGDTASFTEPGCFASASLQLTAYLDGSILELFTNSGRCATVRMYPTSPPPWSLEVQGINQGDNVDCWLLSS